MYDTILVGVDMSEQSDRAVAAAEDLARLSGGKIHIVHMREQDLVTGRGAALYDTESAGEADELLAKEAQRVQEAGLSVSTEVRTVIAGQVADQIVAAAKDHDADIIVVGSHGRSGIARVLLGGTAYKVLHLADRPVLVVK